MDLRPRRPSSVSGSPRGRWSMPARSIAGRSPPRADQPPTNGDSEGSVGPGARAAASIPNAPAAVRRANPPSRITAKARSGTRLSSSVRRASRPTTAAATRSRRARAPALAIAPTGGAPSVTGAAAPAGGRSGRRGSSPSEPATIGDARLAILQSATAGPALLLAYAGSLGTGAAICRLLVVGGGRPSPIVAGSLGELPRLPARPVTGAAAPVTNGAPPVGAIARAGARARRLRVAAAVVGRDARRTLELNL